jgi:6-phosphogluconolactonase (cycloisomerase 2 family)
LNGLRLTTAPLAALAILALAAGAASAAERERDPKTRPVVFVANAEGGTVTVVDARRLRVLKEINVLPDGEEASPEEDPQQSIFGQRLVEAAGGENFVQDQDVSPDGRILYVSRGHRGDVAAFRLRSGRMLWKTPVEGVRADHLELTEHGRRLYVSDLTENVVHRIRAKDGAIRGSFPTGDWPHDNHLTHDGRLLYNGSLGNILVPEEARAQRSESYRLTVADPQSLEVRRTYEFERGIRPFVFSPNERRIYMQLSMFHGLVEFDLERGEIRRRLELPIDEGVTEEDFDFEAPHHGLDISADGKTLCAAGRASDYVALVSRRRMRAKEIIDVADAPGWATTGPGGHRCYVTNTRADTLSVISYRKQRELARLKVGDAPKHVETGRVPKPMVRAWREIRSLD